MNIHILGICGTFMGSLALLARDMGFQVSGSDSNVYPPMSTQLQHEGIEVMDGYDPAYLAQRPDLVVVGNTLSRGNPAIEYMLNQGMAYVSGPQWLADHVLQGKHVLAVSGTHGKTTTSSMLAWILEYAGLKPGFLIGGVVENFGVSARLGDSNYFVVEADEYDTAFFDKRAKFIHYRARTLLLNNIEYDHADIYPGMDEIRRQFHHLLRPVPGNGLVVRHEPDMEIDRVIQDGCWTPCQGFGLESSQWALQPQSKDYSRFAISFAGESRGDVSWDLIGRHNAENALAAVACANNVGVESGLACRALADFKSVKRRLQLRGSVNGVNVYDDFAHHPTAITATLEALRSSVGPDSRIIAVLEPRSNTMRMGVHSDTLAASLAAADMVYMFQPEGLKWDLAASLKPLGEGIFISTSVDSIVEELVNGIGSGDQVLVMSNGGFQGIHEKILKTLEQIS